MVEQSTIGWALMIALLITTFRDLFWGTWFFTSLDRFLTANLLFYLGAWAVLMEWDTEEDDN